MDKCTTCGKQYSAECDWNQGRCPNHPPLLNITPKDTSKGHFYVSIVKSAVRIVAGGCLITGNLLMAGVCFIMAEVLGIVEELV